MRNEQDNFTAVPANAGERNRLNRLISNTIFINIFILQGHVVTVTRIACSGILSGHISSVRRASKKNPINRVMEISPTSLNDTSD
ncbi:hypothetical protein C5T94_06700 [Raoultella ornithinolytica]|nr:hypothetical protein C5T92_00190 [Raoultella ornithinolytica]PQH23490.1 hypothetical protein CWD63_14925 [Raoultella ornithinolytica]PQH37805.1 hypothetical protein C5T94_06700 [Raoultella ornithinolytica]RLP19991.1 hypothetical protein D9D10_06945 [Raoultella ornithinolytica]RWS97168.1 hypothetical protein DN592_23215 [Raoultella ornithinolytica]